MPGPVSDSYDPEWGTSANGDNIRQALKEMHDVVSTVLEDQPPFYILDLIDMRLPKKYPATLNERQWRLLRFACERAMESIWNRSKECE